jgi:hypothetical protein
MKIVLNWPITVAPRFKACISDHSLAAIVGSDQPGTWISVCRDCCVLSGRVPCVGLITRPEESSRVWCVWMWLWNLDSILRKTCPTTDCSSMKEKGFLTAPYYKIRYLFPKFCAELRNIGFQIVGPNICSSK